MSWSLSGRSLVFNEKARGLDNFGAAPHHDVLLLLVQIATLLTVARLLGEVCLRFGQPAVLGELGAGILLGPSLLGGMVPVIGFHVIPHNQAQGYLLGVVSLLGSMFLLLITGMETDLKLIQRRMRTAVGVWAGGVFVPLVSGFALGMVLPDSLLGNPSQRVIFAMFIATAMSISALSVLAKMLRDLNLTRRDVGQIMMAAGMTEDATGWILLSIVIALSSGTGFSLAQVGIAGGKVLLFIVISVVVGRPVVRAVLRSTQDNIRSRDRMITAVFVTTMAFAAFTMSLGLEPVLGAFTAGLLFSTMPRLPASVGHFYESLAMGIFAPIFFAVAGLKVDLNALLRWDMLLYTVATLSVACFGKVVGTYLGARLIGKSDHWTALAMGAGLNARGSMEIIIATLGLNLGILTQESFSMIVVIAPVTSLLAPPALRYAVSRMRLSAEEASRLAREEQDASNWLTSIHRVLIPVRYRPDLTADDRKFDEAVFAILGGQRRLSVTLMTVVPAELQAQAAEWLKPLAAGYAPHEVVFRVTVSNNPTQAVLDELQKDYGLLMLGAPESNPNTETLFSSLIDELVRLSPCPTLVLRKGHDSKDSHEFRRILVPTNGGAAANRAANLALTMAEGTTHHVEFLRVLVRDRDQELLDARDDGRQSEFDQAYESLSELVLLGEGMGISCGSEIRVADGPAAAIISLAGQPGKANLVVLGTDVRPGGRLFLGPRVERVLRHSRAPVIVLNS